MKDGSQSICLIKGKSPFTNVETAFRASKACAVLSASAGKRLAFSGCLALVMHRNSIPCLPILSWKNIIHLDFIGHSFWISARQLTQSLLLLLLLSSPAGESSNLSNSKFRPRSLSSSNHKNSKKSTQEVMSSDYKVWGVPLKYLSLAALTIQNSAVTIVMHQSRIVNSPSKSYFAPSAVLLSELLKGFISLVVALWGIDRDLMEMEGGGYAALGSEEGRISTREVNVGMGISTISEIGDRSSPLQQQQQQAHRHTFTSNTNTLPWTKRDWKARFARLYSDVFSSDCWKLSIPAVLYVL